MISNLTKKEGIYDPTKRFAFTNITEKDFTFTWDKKPITVKAKETVEMKEYLAILATSQLTTQIILDKAQQEEEKIRQEKGDPYWRSRIGYDVSIPAKREIYEKQIMKELPTLTGNDADLQIKRVEMINQLQQDMKQTQSPLISRASDIGLTPAKASEFVDVNVAKKQ